MMAAIVDKIEADPDKKGLQKAREVCRRWMELHDNPYIEEWHNILDGRWEDIKHILLEDSEEANSLRQCNPFCGILTPKERWAIYREFGSVLPELPEDLEDRVSDILKAMR